MRRTMLVLAVVALVVHAYALPAPDTADEEQPCCTRSNSRLNAQFVRLNRLTADIQALSDAVDARSKSADSVSHTLGSLSRKLVGLEGTGCAEHEFQCGGSQKKCIATSLVCDKNVDCPNSSDESDLTCEAVIKAGDVWEGAPSYDYCTQRRPYKAQVVIKSVTDREFFHPLVQVDAQLLFYTKTSNYKAIANLPGQGNYEFGSRTLTFEPPEADNLALEAKFDFADNDHMHAYVVRSATGERCAMFVLRKV